MLCIKTASLILCLDMLHELYIRYMVTEAITTLTGSEPLLQYIVTGGLLIEHVLLRQWIENRGASQYIFKWQVFNVCMECVAQNNLYHI